jgi:hypothetical protein
VETLTSCFMTASTCPKDYLYQIIDVENVRATSLHFFCHLTGYSSAIKDSADFYVASMRMNTTSLLDLTFTWFKGQGVGFLGPTHCSITKPRPR